MAAALREHEEEERQQHLDDVSAIDPLQLNDERVLLAAQRSKVQTLSAAEASAKENMLVAERELNSYSETMKGRINQVRLAKELARLPEALAALAVEVDEKLSPVFAEIEFARHRDGIPKTEREDAYHKVDRAKDRLVKLLAKFLPRDVTRAAGL